MTQFRIDVTKLADELDDVLAHAAAGDEVLIEREGEVVGEFQPATPATLPKGSLGGFIQALRESPPIDDDFIAAIEDAIASRNRPQPALRPGNFAEFLRVRSTRLPVDDDFQRDVEAAMAEGNTLPEPVNWD